MYYFLIPVSLFLVFGLIPERKFSLIFSNLGHIKQYFSSIFGGDGDKFLIYLAGVSQMSTSSAESIPKYKFYTNLIIKLNHFSRLFGVTKGKIIHSLRDGVFEDYKFERKLQAIYFNFLYQSLSMTALTWGFIFLVRNIMKLSIGNTELWLIIILQVIGPVFFTVIFLYIKNKIFSPFNHYLKSIYTFKVLSDVGLCISKINDESDISALLNYNLGDKGILYKRLILIIQKIKQNGGPIQNDLNELEKELWFLQDQAFEKFIKISTGLRFLTLALFYLSSYFIFILSIFSGLI